MRFGWLAAAAAFVCAGQAGAQTFVQYELTGTGTLTTLIGGTPRVDNGQAYVSTFSVLTTPGLYFVGGSSYYDVGGSTSGFSGPSGLVRATGDGSVSGLLTYSDIDGNPSGHTVNLSINYADTDAIGGFPLALASNATTGSISYSGGYYLGSGQSFTGSVSNFRIVGSSSTFSGFTFTAVPEPATWLAMILGFAVIGGALRRLSSDSSAARPARRRDMAR